MVVAAFLAGGILAWVPLTSGPLPFRDTSMYPVWAFLFASICGSCPLVWNHGIRALGELDAHRPVIREVAGYGALAVLFTGISLVAGAAVYLRGNQPVEILPYLQVRFAIVYLAALVAVSPSMMAMLRIREATRHDKVRAAELVTWRAILQSQLVALGAVIALSTLTTASLGSAVHAAYPRTDFSVGGALLFGAFFTMILALVYGPPAGQLRQRAEALVDEIFPIPDHFDGDWQQQLQRRRDLSSMLQIDQTSQNSLQNALIIGGPLITSALTLLILPH